MDCFLSDSGVKLQDAVHKVVVVGRGCIYYCTIFYYVNEYQLENLPREFPERNFRIVDGTVDSFTFACSSIMTMMIIINEKNVSSVRINFDSIK